MRKIMVMLVTLLFSFVFFACSSGENPAAQGQVVTITMEAENAAGVGAYRSILPDSWIYGAKANASELYYAITAYTVADIHATEADGILYYADGKNGYSVAAYENLVSGKGISLSFAPAVWRITLSAYATPIEKTDSEQTAANGTKYYGIKNTDMVLTATQTVDVTDTATALLRFSLLSATGEHAAPGTFEFDLSFYPPDTFKKVVWGLYAYQDMSLVGDIESYTVSDTAAFEACFGTDTVDMLGYASYYYTKESISYSVTPGKYWFIAQFIDENDKRIGYCPVFVVVEGNNVSYGDIVLGRKTFNASPLSCTDLVLSNMTFNGGMLYTQSSWAVKAEHNAYQVIADDAVSARVKTVSVTFKWTVNASNEEGFWVRKRSVVRYDGDTPVWSDWENYDFGTEEDYKDKAHAVLVNGTAVVMLDAQTDSFTGSFDTGKCYQISIKPWNMYSSTDTEEGAAFDSPVVSEPFGIFTIMYKLTYTDADSTEYAGAVAVGTHADPITGTYLVVPYVYGDDSHNTLIPLAYGTDVSHSYPNIQIDSSFEPDSLHWYENDEEIADTTLNAYAGGDKTLILR